MDTQYVTFGLEGQVFAAPVSQVAEILDVQPITRLPGAPPGLLGLIDVRGQGVLVADLAPLLSLSAGPETSDTRLLVLSVDSANGTARRAAVKTDRVFEVTTLDEDDVGPGGEDLLGWNHRAVLAIGRRRDAFVAVLDMARLLSSVDLGVTLPRSA